MAGFPQPPAKIVPFRRASIPPHDLERQFDEHSQAFRKLLDFLRTVIRDDGRLRNGTLGKEQLDPELVKEITRQFIPEIEDTLRETKLEATSARLAAQEVHSLLLKIREREQAISNAARVMSATAQKARERLAELQAFSPPDSVSSQALARTAQPGVLGPPYNGMPGFYGADDQGASAIAQDYAEVSMNWAEYMPGTIPPNILAINAVTGDHWSSRWWANRAAGAFGMMAWWYQGAWPQPGPPSTPLTPTGDPLPIGAMYFDTTLDNMMVWNGSGWQNSFAPQAAAVSSLYYTSSPGQVIFPLSTPDLNGATFLLNANNPEGLISLVNGVRLMPTNDFTIDIPSSTVTMKRPIPAGSIVTFDVLTPKSQLAPTGSASTMMLAPITPDGTTTVFAGLLIAYNDQPPNIGKNEELIVSVDGVWQQPGGAYNASGDTITFTEAPPADSKVFMIWLGPATPTGAYGGMQIIGMAKGVNWSVAGDTQVSLVSNKCLPISALSVNFQNQGNLDGGASIYTAPLAGGTSYGPAPVGPFEAIGGPSGQPLNTAAMLINFTQNTEYLAQVYINVTTPDSGTPAPTSDVYILGIDLTALL